MDELRSAGAAAAGVLVPAVALAAAVVIAGATYAVLAGCTQACKEWKHASEREKTANDEPS